MQQKNTWDVPHDFDEFGVDIDVVGDAIDAEEVNAEMACDGPGHEGTYAEVYLLELEDRYLY